VHPKPVLRGVPSSLMKNLRVLIWLLVLGAAVYTGVKVVPAYIANYRLAEFIDDAARSAAVSAQRSDDDIRSAVYQNAQDLEIPLKSQDIRIERSGGDVAISADYIVHIDVPVHPFDLEFHPSSKRETFTFR
jgi:hypothetical protein